MINRSTDYHFEDFEAQFSAALDILENDPREGDLICTKHSNLPMIHLILHLIISNEPLNSASNTVTGYKNALGLALNCDVNYLTIPLLLSADNSTLSNANEDLKRAEYVLKATRAMLNEWNHSNTQTGFSHTLDRNARSIQFVLPLNENSNFMFHQVKEKIKELYKTM